LINFRDFDKVIFDYVSVPRYDPFSHYLHFQIFKKS
jgi:hypothetical protein